jgi:hypothetical protein
LVSGSGEATISLVPGEHVALLRAEGFHPAVLRLRADEPIPGLVVLVPASGEPEVERTLAAEAAAIVGHDRVAIVGSQGARARVGVSGDAWAWRTSGATTDEVRVALEALLAPPRASGVGDLGAPTEKPDEATPWYARWWVWTIAAAVVAGGVILGVALATGGGDECPDDVCIPF